MAEFFPDVQEVRDLIKEAERIGFEKDRQCLANIRQTIIGHMKDQPKRNMKVVLRKEDVGDRSRCDRLMERICSELRQKGFQSDWKEYYYDDCRGEPCWNGVELNITVSGIESTI